MTVVDSAFNPPPLLFILLCSASVRPRLHSRLTVSHDETVMCCGYSQEFRQVVSCTERSVSKLVLYNLTSPLYNESGQIIFIWCILSVKLSQHVTRFRWWKSGILTLGSRFLSLVAQMICLPPHAWPLTPTGGGTAHEAACEIFHFHKKHLVNTSNFCFQTHHGWERWLFEDLELQQWSVPEDT